MRLETIDTRQTAILKVVAVFCSQIKNFYCFCVMYEAKTLRAFWEKHRDSEEYLKYGIKLRARLTGLHRRT